MLGVFTHMFDVRTHCHSVLVVMNLNTPVVVQPFLDRIVTSLAAPIPRQ